MNYQKIQSKIIELIPIDKALHFIIGYFLFGVISLFLNDFYSLGVVFLLALAKETRDEITYKGGDWKDILFTIAPALFNISLTLFKNHII